MPKHKEDNRKDHCPTTKRTREKINTQTQRGQLKISMPNHKEDKRKYQCPNTKRTREKINAQTHRGQ
jgi:hypothetical protein